jgi:hypothetical protein
LLFLIFLKRDVQKCASLFVYVIGSRERLCHLLLGYNRAGAFSMNDVKLRIA